jgi:hypothetical protein
LAQFAEQPRVLHRDYCLSGEGAHQFDLPLGVWLHAIPRETNRADHGSLAQQWHSKVCTYPGCHGLGHRVVRVREYILDMHDPAFERHPPGHAVATGDNPSLLQDRPIFGFRSGDRHIAVDLALAYRDRCDICAAKPTGGFDHCVQHGLHIGGTAADDVEHIARGGLVFDRLVALGSALGKLPLQIGYPLLGIG